MKAKLHHVLFVGNRGAKPRLRAGLEEESFPCCMSFPDPVYILGVYELQSKLLNSLKGGFFRGLYRV